MENIYYVYHHIRPDTGEVFYVGKGKARRAYCLTQRNRYHKNIQSKLASLGMAVDIVIIRQGLTEKESFEIEMSEIARLKSIGQCSANITMGGEKGGGVPLTDEHKRKLSESHKGQRPTPEQKKKISAKLKGRKRAEWEKEKCSAALRAAWDSGRLEHVREVSRANMLALHAKGNHIQKLKDAWENENRKNMAREWIKACYTPEARANWQAVKARKVVCLNDGMIFDTIMSAEKHYGLPKSKVSAVCKGQRSHTKGLSFAYLEEDGVVNC